jgi:hypothetical protein
MLDFIRKVYYYNYAVVSDNGTRLFYSKNIAENRFHDTLKPALLLQGEFFYNFNGTPVGSHYLIVDRK